MQKKHRHESEIKLLCFICFEVKLDLIPYTMCDVGFEFYVVYFQNGIIIKEKWGKYNEHIIH